MSEFRIAVVVGSLRRESYNRRLAESIKRLAPPDVSFHDSRIDDLPLYNQDEEANPPEPVRRFKKEINSAQGVLFVTPEYNRSIPGVLKNAIDHASRPYGHSVWKGKPASIIGASIGAAGTSMAQQHLRNMLAYLDVPVLGQPEVFIQVKNGFFDDSGGIANAETRRFLQGWMDKFLQWVKVFSDRQIAV